jgi:hypothetical protein
MCTLNPAALPARPIFSLCVGWLELVTFAFICERPTKGHHFFLKVQEKPKNTDLVVGIA